VLFNPDNAAVFLHHVQVRVHPLILMIAKIDDFDNWEAMRHLIGRTMVLDGRVVDAAVSPGASQDDA